MSAYYKSLINGLDLTPKECLRQTPADLHCQIHECTVINIGQARADLFKLACLGELKESGHE